MPEGDETGLDLVAKQIRQLTFIVVVAGLLLMALIALSIVLTPNQSDIPEQTELDQIIYVVKVEDMPIGLVADQYADLESASFRIGDTEYETEGLEGNFELRLDFLEEYPNGEVVELYYKDL